MDPRRLPAPARERRFGRRAGDAELKARFTAAAFAAQVAGLSMPRERGAGTYELSEPAIPLGLVRDERV
jgi:hypothetical protein